jgi:hypothetical protein
MNKRTPSVDWTITQSDAEWEHLQGPPQPDSEAAADRHLHLKRYFWSVAALLLLLVSAGDWWWRTAQGTTHPAAADMTATAQQELGKVEQVGEPAAARPLGHQSRMDWWYQQEREESSLRVALQGDEPEAPGVVELHRLGFQGDQAVARIVTTDQQGAPTYRQIRFYRHTATGWVQTAPDAALWGPERSLETPYFVYHFRQNDAQAVIAVAPQMDALYRILRRNFALPLTPSVEKLVIEVSVTQPPGGLRSSFAAPNRFRVASAALCLAPVALTDAQLLAQSLMLPLLEFVLAQAKEQYALHAPWQPMLSGLRLWQVWDLELPLSGWRYDIVQWLYVDLPAVAPGQSVVLPEHYTALCATHKLWLASPVQLNLPLVCARPEWEAQSFPLWRLRDPPTRLDQLALPIRAYEHGTYLSYLTQVQLPTRTVALATLVEYAVAAYGRERLPALVAGLGQYNSWDTLLSAVYGVSPAEFEAGWQAYLSAHYGVPLPLRASHH